MKSHKLTFTIVTLVLGVFLLGSRPASAQLKLGYIDSQKILGSYKEAQDVQKQLKDLNAQWENEARNMQKEIQELQDQLESQSLLLSEEKKQEKQQEIQKLYLDYQQYLQVKFGPQGEGVKKEVELLDPVLAKVRAAIKKLGEAEGFDYIFDVVQGNILYVSDHQTDLTDKVLAELNKGLPTDSSSSNK